MDGAPTPGPPAGVAPPPEAGPDPAPAPAPAAPSAPAPEGGASGPADDDGTRRQRGGGGAGGASSRPGPRPLLEDTVPLVAAPAGPVPEDVAAKVRSPPCGPRGGARTCGACRRRVPQQSAALSFAPRAAAWT